MATLLPLLVWLINLLVFTDAQSVGVCYGAVGDDLPSAKDVVSLYKSNNISRMRIYNSDHTILEALKGTNIELIIGVPNGDLVSLNDQHMADIWVRDNIQYYSDVSFRYIAVGNEYDPDTDDDDSIVSIISLVCIRLC